MLSLSILGTLFWVFFVFHIIFFVFHPVGKFWSVFSHALIVPAAIVHGIHVPYSCIPTYEAEYKEAFPEGKSSVLFLKAFSRCVYDARITALAKELHVATDHDPLRVAQDTERAVLSEAAFQDGPKEQIEVLRRRIAENLPFADAARRYSEHASGGSGGDLGVFLVDTAPSWMRSVFDLQIGEISETLEGVDAFWLMTVTERGGSGGEAWVRVSGIAAKKTTMREVLSVRIASDRPWVFVW